MRIGRMYPAAFVSCFAFCGILTIPRCRLILSDRTRRLTPFGCALARVFG